MEILNQKFLYHRLSKKFHKLQIKSSFIATVDAPPSIEYYKKTFLCDHFCPEYFQLILSVVTALRPILLGTMTVLYDPMTYFFTLMMI